MSDFIWVLPRDKAASLGEIGISSTYILPRAHVAVGASDLVGSVIWVVFRGESDRLALVMRAHEVDIILDGYYRGDFLLKPDMRHSLRVGSAFGQLSAFVTDVSATAREGISEISFADVNKLLLLLKKNMAVRLTPPGTKTLSSFIVEYPPKNKELLARLITQIAVSSFNFSDIWCDGRQKKYRNAPFASMAKAYIEQQFSMVNLLEIEDALINSDPIVWIFNRKFEAINVTQIAREDRRVPRVDTLFKELDPNNIFSREFSTPDLSNLNLLDQIKKTEAAERRHQEILRDVSSYFLGVGIKPLQSESVDLACILRGALYVFEIKTANLENVISQASKGAFQLAYYKNALVEEYESIAISLVLEDTGSADLNEFILETMWTLGIRTCIYNGNVPWPNRLQSFPLGLIADANESFIT